MYFSLVYVRFSLHFTISIIVIDNCINCNKLYTRKILCCGEQIFKLRFNLFFALLVVQTDLSLSFIFFPLSLIFSVSFSVFKLIPSTKLFQQQQKQLYLFIYFWSLDLSSPLGPKCSHVDQEHHQQQPQRVFNQRLFCSVKVSIMLWIWRLVVRLK